MRCDERGAAAVIQFDAHLHEVKRTRRGKGKKKGKWWNWEPVDGGYSQAYLAFQSAEASKNVVCGARADSAEA